MRRRSRQASRATSWGLLGTLLLVAGCFAPIAAQPGGAATLLSSGSIPARMILVAALSAVALVLLGRRRALLVPGGFAGLMVLAELFANRSRLAVVSDSSPNAILSSFANEWGWALLVVGVALLLLAGLFPGHRRRSSRVTGDGLDAKRRHR